jgi:threonine dehydratase
MATGPGHRVAPVRVVPTVEEIADAAAHLDPAFARSPLLRGTPLDRTGARVELKVETLNPIRSFKGRGASTWMRQVRRTGPEVPGVVCASVGNFGQGLGHAARAAGVPCRVFVGASANPLKLDAIRALGAEVEVGGDSYEDAIVAARGYAERTGQHFVQDGRDPYIAAGAGTIAYELTEDGVRPDVALIPVGNSALILGIAVWLRHCRPDVRIVGVCAEGAPAPALSWRERRVVSTPGVHTSADGIAVAQPFEEAVAGMLEYVDDMVLVGEDSLHTAVRLIADELSLLVEPAGGAGVAALLDNPEAYAGAQVFTPLCGGHLHPGTLTWSWPEV